MEDKEYFKKMLELQDEFNSKVHPEWRSQDFDNPLASILECAEAIDQSCDWKWWKKGKDDDANYEVEAIDIWHFVQSIGLQKYSIDYLERLCTKVYTDFMMGYAFRVEVFDKIGIAKVVMYEILKYDLEDKSEEQYEALITVVFRMIFNHTSIDTIDELYAKYITKNILNKFRQNNGYKEGTYVKVWNGKEDNEVAYSIISTNNTLSVDEFYNELIKAYPNKGK